MYKMFSERRTEQLLAITYGLLCHSLFLMAGMIMFWTLLNGFVVAQGTVSYPLAIISNLILLLQFPAGHSFFLSEQGHRFLRWFAPKKYWQTLSTTTYTSIASFQLLLLFYFWSPSGVIIYHYQWPWNIIHLIFFSISWLFLSLSSYQAGYKIQTGSLGWTSLFRGISPLYPGMPQTGLFSLVRQPIYLSFCLILWTSPLMTLDLLVVAIAYSAYCYFAPRLKEGRFKKYYGKEFSTYQKKVPYFFPQIRKFKLPTSKEKYY